MAEDETTLAAIHRLYLEIDENEQKMRALKQNIKDVLLQNEEYQEIEEKLKEAAALRERRKTILKTDRDYVALGTELEELKFKHKDLMEIMSHHLMVYRDETHENVIKDPDGDWRQVLVSARVGKPTVETQRMDFEK